MRCSRALLVSAAGGFLIAGALIGRAVLAVAAAADDTAPGLTVEVSSVADSAMLVADVPVPTKRPAATPRRASASTSSPHNDGFQRAPEVDPFAPADLVPWQKVTPPEFLPHLPVDGGEGTPVHPGMRAVEIIRYRPVTILGSGGRQHVVQQPVRELVFIPLDSPLPPNAVEASSDGPIDAQLVVRTDRIAALRVAFEEKLALMLAAEMDGELSSLKREIRELEAQTRMRQIRQQLSDLQQQLSETAPAHAAAYMLAVPVPQLVEEKRWVEGMPTAVGPTYTDPINPSFDPPVKPYTPSGKSLPTY